MNVRSSLARAFPRLRPRRQPQRQSALLQQQPQCRASSSFFFGHRQVAAAEADQHQQHQAQVLSPSSSSDSIQMNHMSAGSPSSNPEAPFTASSTHEPLNAAAATAATAGASFNSVNSSEIAHFSRLSSQWWDERGEFAFLHRMNPVRMEFVREKVMRGEMDDEGWSFEKRDRVGSDGKIIESKSDAKVDAGKWLRGMDVLDVGCGGGLLTESLARVGGRALGIDASAENIAIASTHASQDPLLPFTTEGTAATGDGPSLSYRQIAAEDLQCEGKRYDLVCSMEVLEHVDAPGEFLKCLGDMVKPGGHLVLSTISRTPLSRLLTITMAENILRQVTPGTHTYSKYIQPSELLAFVRDHMGGRDVWESDGDGLVEGGREGGGLSVGEVRGIVYNPLDSRWHLWRKGWPGGDLCNYMFHIRKRKDA